MADTNQPTGITMLAGLLNQSTHVPVVIYLSAGWQVGKPRKPKEDKPKEEGVGMNIKSIVVVALLMMLMLFAVHCTWVTSNAYSSPSIVLASYGHDG